MQLYRDRPNLSNQATRAVRDLILDGKLSPGSRVNEVHLANQLGVSRTPLREALSVLIVEGFVSSIPRRGYFVRELSVEEVQHLYAIRSILDPEALRMSGIPGPKQIKKLENLNEAIGRAQAGDSGKVIQLDDAWHLLLLERCPNPILMDMIQQHMARTQRYEHAYFKAGHNVGIAVEEHADIIRRLRKGELDHACNALRTNMESAREPLLTWLRQRKDEM